MKFDYIIGNPPYHYETGRRKIPMYPDFIMSTTDPLLAGVTCLITPDGFIKGGQQLEPLRKYMEGNPHLCSIDFYKNQLFPGKSVDAAVMLFDNKHIYSTVKKTVTMPDGSYVVDILDWQYRDVIVDSLKYDVLHIFERIISGCSTSMADLIPGRGPFGLSTKGYKEHKDMFKDIADSLHDTRILVGEDKDFYWINKNDDFSYEGCDSNFGKVKTGNIDKWKMVFPKAGQVEKKPLSTIILAPYEIFTEKYLCIFADSENEARNVEKYFNCKFYRAGLASKMTSWIMMRGWHGNIPVQDFTDSSDIDWSKSMSDIDRQLYVKYKLSSEEIRLIETFIKG